MRVNTPEIGWYWLREIRFGPRVPVIIFKAVSLDPNFPDNPMDRSPVLACYVGQREVDPIAAWHWCAGNPITEEEYTNMLGEPPVDTSKPVDIRAMKPAF